LGRKLMSLNELKGAVAKANGFGVVFFDACRNSFFSGQIQGLGSGRGSRALVQPTVRRGQNILVSFSTQAGKIAKDDVANGNHSPYALALSENLNSSKDIRLVMGSVRAKVKKLTDFEQIPVEVTELDGEEYCLSGDVNVILGENKKEENNNEIVVNSVSIPTSTKKVNVNSILPPTKWLNTFHDEYVTWEEAKKICKKDGGVLPSVSDLKKIINDCKKSVNNTKISYESCYKQKGFTDNTYWSSSGDSSETSHFTFSDSSIEWSSEESYNSYYGVDFSLGLSYSSDKNKEHKVRCIEYYDVRLLLI